MAIYIIEFQFYCGYSNIVFIKSLGKGNIRRRQNSAFYFFNIILPFGRHNLPFGKIKLD
ncbi:hypothetical protein CHRY9293_01371 [Chryseobacterium potabilaquae]|uniref:Uncharacterized protein n=1 Tax=Chryseobacterium potabilaquae TaxID=2675057 RepID=A0A6N4X6E0_9FLAO|nr:hypothetical protein CHRY9293_01371 [Chryseobacterium potabilaquae]